jgi:hypothetical protein
MSPAPPQFLISTGQCQNLKALTRKGKKMPVITENPKQEENQLTLIFYSKVFLLIIDPYKLTAEKEKTFHIVLILM